MEATDVGPPSRSPSGLGKRMGFRTSCGDDHVNNCRFVIKTSAAPSLQRFPLALSGAEVIPKDLHD